MQKNGLKRQVPIFDITVLLFIAYPIFYYCYLTILANGNIENMRIILEQTPLLALNLIIYCIFPFIGMYINSLKKQPEVQNNSLISVATVLLILIGVMAVGQIFMAGLCGYLLINLMKRNQIEWISGVHELRNNINYYLKKSVPALVFTIILISIRMLILIRQL